MVRSAEKPSQRVKSACRNLKIYRVSYNTTHQFSSLVHSQIFGICCEHLSKPTEKGLKTACDKLPYYTTQQSPVCILCAFKCVSCTLDCIDPSSNQKFRKLHHCNAPFKYNNVDSGTSAVGVLTENKGDRMLPMLSARSQTSLKILQLDIHADIQW